MEKSIALRILLCYDGGDTDSKELQLLIALKNCKKSCIHVYLKKEWWTMETAQESHDTAMDTYRNDVRSMVLAGLDQIRDGDVKDFADVCDRLELKYRNAALRN